MFDVSLDDGADVADILLSGSTDAAVENAMENISDPLIPRPPI